MQLLSCDPCLADGGCTHRQPAGARREGIAKSATLVHARSLPGQPPSVVRTPSPGPGVHRQFCESPASGTAPSSRAATVSRVTPHRPRFRPSSRAATPPSSRPSTVSCADPPQPRPLLVARPGRPPLPTCCCTAYESAVRDHRSVARPVPRRPASFLRIGSLAARHSQPYPQHLHRRCHAQRRAIYRS